MRQIQGELQRLNKLITDVSATSRLDAELARQEMQPVDLTVVLENVVKIFREILQANTRSVSLVIEHAKVDSPTRPSSSMATTAASARSSPT